MFEICSVKKLEIFFKSSLMFSGLVKITLLSEDVIENS